MLSVDKLWTVTAARIPTAAYEMELIASAATGDERATLRLFTAYVAALSGAVAVYTRSLPLDDARQAAFLGFLTAIREFDPAQSDRLASIVRQYAHEALAEALCATHSGFTVPSRSLRRYLTILARAGSNPADGAKLAPQYEMTADTFWAIRAAIFYGGEPDENDMVPSDDSAITDIEDRDLTALAFKAVTRREADVVRLAYGFADYDPQPDAEVGHRLGMSRLSAHRTRHRALDKMRARVGA